MSSNRINHRKVFNLEENYINLRVEHTYSPVSDAGGVD
jgi:hypothetical protein